MKATIQDDTGQLVGVLYPEPKHIQFIIESSQGNMRSAENTLEQVCQIKGGRL